MTRNTCVSGCVDACSKAGIFRGSLIACSIDGTGVAFVLRRSGSLSHKNILPGTAAMTIELTKEVRADAIASIQRYFEKNMEEPIGNIAAGALLGFFLEEIGPTIYNKAVADAQERLQQSVLELDIEVHEEEFQYWKKYEVKAKPRR